MFCGRYFCSGQKRGRQVGKTKRGKGTKIMGIADGHGLPVALRTESASPAEVKLVPATLEARIVAEVPERLIGDKAYDSDRMDEQLMQNYGTELIAPNKVKISGRPRQGPMPHNGFRPFDPSAAKSAFPDFAFTPLEIGLAKSQVEGAR